MFFDLCGCDVTSIDGDSAVNCASKAHKGKCFSNFCWRNPFYLIVYHKEVLTIIPHLVKMQVLEWNYNIRPFFFHRRFLEKIWHFYTPTDGCVNRCFMFNIQLGCYHMTLTISFLKVTLIDDVESLILASIVSVFVLSAFNRSSVSLLFSIDPNI